MAHALSLSRKWLLGQISTYVFRFNKEPQDQPGLLIGHWPDVGDKFHDGCGIWLIFFGVGVRTAAQAHPVFDVVVDDKSNSSSVKP